MKPLLAMLLFLSPSYILTAQTTPTGQPTPSGQIARSDQHLQPSRPAQPAPSAPPAYDQYPVYTGKDLGMTWSKTSSRFRIWSPTATQAQLLLYKDDTHKGDTGNASSSSARHKAPSSATRHKAPSSARHPAQTTDAPFQPTRTTDTPFQTKQTTDAPFQIVDMTKVSHGDWYTKLTGDWKGTLYAFRVKIGNTWSLEVPDPYARAVGINGKRGMIIDPKDTDPPGWASDKSPAFSKTNSPTDAIIYELHIRDASIDPGSGIQHKGLFAGLAESGTVSKQGLATGLDHLKELGVTHIHLLPFFDYNSVDESRPDSAQYNWGYDPLNYNTPEGSYSTNPYDGITRIKELKQLVAAFHRHGLRIIMDVVYNHTALTGASNFNQLVPGYYYRHNADNSFSNATACGNETASERTMMRKFMLESILYWAKEYHIDGFRFDLMGVHDITTMNSIADSLHAIRPDIILYGEGWTAGASPLPDSLRALKKNVSKLHHIAVFNDDTRDAIKGSVFDIHDKGFVSGKTGMEESVKFGIVAACRHPQVDYSKVNYSKTPYADAPGKVITYCECHDNNTLWDKLALSCTDANAKDREKMHRLALTIVLTSQGIPFLHAGTEFLRSKKGVENSYNAGDSINAIDWRLKSVHNDLVKYIETLIRMRRAHPAFRMTTARQVIRNIRFDKASPAGTIVYTIDGAAMHDTWKTIRIAFNGTASPADIALPPGNWHNAFDQSTSTHVEAYSAMIVYKK